MEIFLWGGIPRQTALITKGPRGKGGGGDGKIWRDRKGDENGGILFFLGNLCTRSLGQSGTSTKSNFSVCNRSLHGFKNKTHYCTGVVGLTGKMAPPKNGILLIRLFRSKKYLAIGARTWGAFCRQTSFQRGFPVVFSASDLTPDLGVQSTGTFS